MEDENEDVTIKIVYDKDTRKVLGAQMVSPWISQWESTCSHWQFKKE